MTRIRQCLVSLALAAVLMLSFAPIGSADPGDPGTGFTTTSTSWDREGSGKKPSRTTFDPGDPGTGY